MEQQYTCNHKNKRHLFKNIYFDLRELKEKKMVIYHSRLSAMGEMISMICSPMETNHYQLFQVC